MEPWTDGVPLTLKFEDRTAGMEPWTDGAPLVFTSELLKASYSGDGALD